LVGCVAGALSDYDYVEKLAKAGFEQIGIERTCVYNINDARAVLSGRGINVGEYAKQFEGKFISCLPQKIECHDFGKSLKRFVA
jgi:arsenite methyltransferase